MNVIDLSSIYDSGPEESFDYEAESELLMKIENQFLINENNIRKTDFIKIYMKDILSIDLDEIESYKVEMYLTESSQQNSFIYLIEEMKKLFFKYFGIDTFEIELDTVDFEFLYDLYDLFVLNLNNTIAYFMHGMRNPANNYVSDPNLYTLQGCYKNHLNKVNNLNTINMSLEEVVELNKELDKSIENDKNGLDIYVRSGESFKDLYEKIILDDNFFTLDFFFDILCLSDENIRNVKFNSEITDGKIPFDNKKFKERIRNEYEHPENFDNLENQYRNLLDSQI